LLCKEEGIWTVKIMVLSFVQSLKDSRIVDDDLSEIVVVFVNVDDVSSI
jgi:hypothetical protein